MELEFDGEVVWWRGPTPFHFVALPEPEVARLRAVAGRVTYGWGCIPATVTLGDTTFTTSLFPKDGGYVVPVKARVRRAEGVELGDDVALTVRIADPDGGAEVGGGTGDRAGGDGPDDDGAPDDGAPDDGAPDDRAGYDRAEAVGGAGRVRALAPHHRAAADDDFYDPADDPTLRRG
ncbi:DUF1905 domain-containing protein [Cellulomonas shaoxiangyii]|uniref:DUF1905 domain-containing protein n=1 Tax=Cellulomonas shaoxiangyii TaxID=2566013 RepID=UPI00140CD418